MQVEKSIRTHKDLRSKIEVGINLYESQISLITRYKQNRIKNTKPVKNKAKKLEIQHSWQFLKNNLPDGVPFALAITAKVLIISFQNFFL